MTKKEEVTVRNAVATDIPRLVEVEKKAWHAQGTEIYDERHFEAWLKLYPEGFFVGLVEGVIMGFGHCQTIHFDSDAVHKLKTFDDVTDNGYTKRTVSVKQYRWWHPTVT